jgi:hypothetical protein
VTGGDRIDPPGVQHIRHRIEAIWRLDAGRIVAALAGPTRSPEPRVRSAIGNRIPDRMPCRGRFACRPRSPPAMRPRQPSLPPTGGRLRRITRRCSRPPARRPRASTKPRRPPSSTIRHGCSPHSMPPSTRRSSPATYRCTRCAATCWNVVASGRLLRPRSGWLPNIPATTPNSACCSPAPIGLRQYPVLASGTHGREHGNAAGVYGPPATGQPNNRLHGYRLSAASWFHTGARAGRWKPESPHPAHGGKLRVLAAWGRYFQQHAEITIIDFSLQRR